MKLTNILKTPTFYIMIIVLIFWVWIGNPWMAIGGVYGAIMMFLTCITADRFNN